jgi:hypothetical protein
MASSRSEANLGAPIRGLGVYAVTWIPLRLALPLFRDRIWLLPRDVRRSALSDMDARGEMDRTMVTAGYVILLIGLVAAVGWGLWQLLAEFNRETDE